MEIRNIAIIAHIDHGKTTLTDALMRQTGMAADGFSMDSNALERERGITIYSKNASVTYKGTKINIVDTPGHADFGCEVERVLRSIDSVLLVVDAGDGPMPQTKFVLRKSLELGLVPIVVINKIDKPFANPHRAHEQVLELFMDLGANNRQLNFKTIYAIAREGIAKRQPGDESHDLSPMLDMILEEVPSASHDDAQQRPLRLQPFNLGYDNFLGRLAVSRIHDGTVRTGDHVVIRKPSGENREGEITRVFTFHGLERKEVPEASAGDIVMISGIADIDIGETVCLSADQEPLPAIAVDEPTISLRFIVNNSPFSGREGKFVTNRQLRERLERELEVNVGLKIDFSTNEYYTVNGRGLLHIAVLLENMRREGYEVQVSQPKVILKRDDHDRLLEPFEEVTIIIPNGIGGVVIEKLAKRKGMMTQMRPEHGQTLMLFEIPTRGLLGYRGEFTMDTRGEGIMYSRVIGFRPHVGEIDHRDLGSMVSMASGKALAFALFNLQERGALYIASNTEVYEGMVVGNVSKGNDLAVNPTKGKRLTNIRAAASDEAIRLTPPLELSLERGLEIMHEDEYLEVAPESIRLRKERLTAMDRALSKRKA